MYEKMIKYVKDYLNKTCTGSIQSRKVFPFRDRFEHTLRVLTWAKRINETEGCDREIIEVAAIFHDIGKGVSSKRLHAEISAELCEEYLLNINFDKNKIKPIVNAVRHHSSKADTNIDLSIEDKIIMDADSLDEVGALTVLWDSMDAGTEPKPEYTKVYHRILNSYEKRKEDVVFLRTSEGKRLYMERLYFLEQFLANLKYELGI